MHYLSMGHPDIGWNLDFRVYETASGMSRFLKSVLGKKYDKGTLAQVLSVPGDKMRRGWEVEITLIVVLNEGKVDIGTLVHEMHHVAEFTWEFMRGKKVYAKHDRVETEAYLAEKLFTFFREWEKAGFPKKYEPESLQDNFPLTHIAPGWRKKRKRK